MFQFTRPRGARPQSVATAKTQARGFNSRAHEGRDLDYVRANLDDWAFQFTRPRGARPDTETGEISANGFNSRAHEGRDEKPSRPRFSKGSFNSRAHEGRDRGQGRRDADGRVSIHAPTRGATEVYVELAKAVGFQFTRPRGARLVRQALEFAAIVSIHAPTRGATCRRT